MGKEMIGYKDIWCQFYSYLEALWNTSKEINYAWIFVICILLLFNYLLNISNVVRNTQITSDSEKKEKVMAFIIQCIAHT